MALTDKENKEIQLYGQFLTGDETALEIARLERKTYLKAKFRPRLAAAIGDYGDNITDSTRAIVLGAAISLGIVTDEAIISGYAAYISAMLEGYGGAASILQTLGQAATGLQQQLVSGYYIAKIQIEQAKTVDDVRKIDLPGEPVTDDMQ